MNKRIFIGPHEIAGYYANLAKGFREIGIDCDYITYISHPFGYGGETRKPVLLRLAKFFNGFRGKPNRSFIIKVLVALPGEVLSSLWGLWAIFGYDVFIFGFGHSLFRNNWDLPILKRLGKIVISNMAHGSEARPPYIDGFFQNIDGGDYPAIKKVEALCRLSKARVERVQNNSSFVIGAPFSTSHFASRPFVYTFAIGAPFAVADTSDPDIYGKIPASLAEYNAVTRILHSPSHLSAKGSPLVIQAIENLKEKGYSIDLVLIHGKQHSEVIQEIKQCDFVVDQVYSDTPMSGFATEAAIFRKPAVVGGYGFDYLKTFVQEDMWPPSKTCHPDELEKAIEEMIVNRDERLKLGVEAQKFVRTKRNPAEVARCYLRMIEDDAPDEWWLDPNSVTYLAGAGQPLERTRENIRKMVDQFGVESLQLSHRPGLEQAFLEFAGVKTTH